MIKNEIRVIGIDDASFDRFRDKETLVIGVLYRGGQFMDGVITTEVKIDGDDSTKKISQMITNSKFLKQTKYLLLDGIAVGGFNVIDVKRLHEKTGLPVIVITRKYPDFEEIICTLKKIGMEQRV